MKEKYKTIKLNKKEINAIKMSIAETLLHYKRYEYMYEDKKKLKNRIKTLNNLLIYFIYLER